VVMYCRMLHEVSRSVKEPFWISSENTQRKTKKEQAKRTNWAERSYSNDFLSFSYHYHDARFTFCFVS
jgi:hypothetical protein